MATEKQREEGRRTWSRLFLVAPQHHPPSSDREARLRAQTGPVRAQTGPVRAQTGPVRARVDERCQEFLSVPVLAFLSTLASSPAICNRLRTSWQRF
eukprot:2924192-Rhodomonas_salina.5